LLHSPLVKSGNGFLIVPVAWGWVEEDALTVLFVGQLDDEFALLIGGGAVREELVAARDELGAVNVSIVKG
jgi:hypothetical protein